MADPVGRYTIVNDKQLNKKELEPPTQQINKILEHSSGKKTYTPSIPEIYSPEDGKMSLFEDLIGRLSIEQTPIALATAETPVIFKKGFSDLNEATKIKIWELVARSQKKRVIIIYMKVRMQQSVRVGAKTVSALWPAPNDLSLKATKYVPDIMHINHLARQVALTVYCPLFETRLNRPIYVNLKIDSVQFKNFQSIKTLWGRYQFERGQNLPGHEDFRKLKKFTMYMESIHGSPAMHTRFLDWVVAQECFVDITIIQESSDKPPFGAKPVLTSEEKKLISYYADFIKNLRKKDKNSTIVAKLEFIDPILFAKRIAATSS